MKEGLDTLSSHVVAEMARCRWTLQASDLQGQDAALLKALFVLTDSAQWACGGGGGVLSATGGGGGCGAGYVGCGWGGE
jgi:hypothetical protein